MFTRVKTAEELDAMRRSGKILGEALNGLGQFISEGKTGNQVSAEAHRLIKQLGGEPAFLGYQGFPDIICISINDEVVHGIPDDRPFKAGDIVSFDFGVRYRGMITDAARTVVIGRAGDRINQLVATTKKSLDAAIAVVHDKVQVGDIGHAAQRVLEAQGLGIVRDLVGHGVGHALHEDPNIPNYGKPNTGPVLTSGMTIAIEPMATLGGDNVFISDDGWTVRTVDGSLAAHFEDTVLITSEGAEILTRV